MEIANIPVPCHICGVMAFGRTEEYTMNNRRIVECIWTCSRCGGVTKRHSEEIPDARHQSTEETPSS